MLKKSNPKIKEKLLGLKGGITDFIVAIGYTDLDDEFYTFVGDYFKVLKMGQTMLTDRLMVVKVKYMTPEEKQKWDLLQNQKKIYIEEQRKKNEAVKKLKE
mmetsp:Transcript_34258/g.33496  ORF Transcript_34258/g.33496 Transcript_34258/m.33496 type:complete len:101 (+) Transcript_34258:197-499(+)|eukprot:CAMPEP_0170540046 /NCGR_PEP_ID=MMETSP0211-20121228/55_1 /TAXON_ID=311385 /ORGANISM="Pseudokeronopsis sp., Strain OXSARD2" /LENGTH=100 /DNA_ID=CAMNT_0010842299 /DNA_START=199 /DNA_END=501 /DNA_ORIENTATION=+